MRRERPISMRWGTLDDGFHWVSFPDGATYRVGPRVIQALEYLSRGERLYSLSREEAAALGRWLKRHRSGCSPSPAAQTRVSFWSWAPALIWLGWVGAGVERTVSRGGWAALWPYVLTSALFLGAAFVHELGHWIWVRGAMPARVRFSWIGPFPALAMDLPETWSLPRWRRLLVDAGGFLADAVVGMAGLVVLLLFPATAKVMRPFLFFHALRAVLSLNPLLPGDGYWLMVDALGCPNLRARAEEAWRARRRNGLALYAILSRLWNGLAWGGTVAGLAWWTGQLW